MAMLYTTSKHSMQTESDGKVKWDSKKKEYKWPSNEKVCNYPVFAVERMYRLCSGYAHDEDAKWVIRTRKIGYLSLCLISNCEAKWVIYVRKFMNSCVHLISTRDAKCVICTRKTK